MNQSDIAGDITIQGALEVLGGINSISNIENITKTSESMGAIAAAQASTNDILDYVADIADDERVTPDEKKILQREWISIAAEYITICADAAAAGIDPSDPSFDAYIDAYVYLDDYLNGASGILDNMATTSTITRSALTGYFSSYVDARVSLLNAIVSAIAIATLVLYITPSVPVIKKSIADVFTPSSVTFSFYYIQGTDAPAAYSGYWKIYETTNGTDWTLKESASANATSKNRAPTGSTVVGIKCELYAAGSFDTLLDTQSIVIVSEGATGATGPGGIAGILSNEAHVFPASVAGAVSSYTGSGTQARVYEGATELTYDGVGTTNGTWELESSATNITRGAITDSGYYATVADHSGVADGIDTASIVYTITGKSAAGVAFTLTKTQTFSKSKQGAAGANAVVYLATPSVPVLAQSEAGVFTPSSVTFNFYSITGNNSPQEFSGYWKIYEMTDGVNWSLVESASANATSKSRTPSGATVDGIKCELYAAGGFTTLLDTQTAMVVRDGPTGDNGTDALSAILSNEAHVFPASVDGAVSSYLGSGTELRLYEGISLLAYDGVGTSNGTWKATPSPTNITVGSLTDSGDYLTVGVHSGVANGTDLSSIVYTITGKRQNGDAFTITKQQSFSKSKTGATGAAGLNSATVTLYKRAATTPTNPSTTSTYTFSTGILTGHDGGWTQAIPSADGNPVWIILATAASTGATDTIGAGEWTAPQILAQDGARTAIVQLYQRAPLAPVLTDIADPVTYTFATRLLSGSLGAWSQSVPSGSNPLYITLATAYGTGTTDTIARSEWTTPTIIAQDGEPGLISAESLDDIADPYEGLLAYRTSDGTYWLYTSSAWVEQSRPSPLPSSICSYHPLDSAPNVPDYAAGITYNGFSGSTDGWSGYLTTLTYESGRLKCVSTNTDPNLTRTFDNTIKGKKIYVKLSGEYNLQYILVAYSGGTFDTITLVQTLPGVYVGTIPTDAVKTVIGLRMDYAQATAKTVYVDFFQIGTGQYSTPAIDGSGNGNHGTMYGPTPIDGPLTKALYFGGTDYITYPTKAKAVCTMAAFVRFTAATANACIIQENGGSGAYKRTRIKHASGIPGLLWQKDASTSDTLNATATYNDGLWHSIVAVWDAALVSLIIDGVLVASKASTLYSAPPDAVGTIGSSPTPADFFTGSIAAVAIVGRAWTLQEARGYHDSKGLASVYDLADWLIDTAASDGTITPAEKQAIAPQWTAIYDNMDATSALSTGVADIANGEFESTRNAANAIGVWTPTTAATAAKTFYDAAEALRAYLFTTPAVLLASTRDMPIPVTAATWRALWASYRAGVSGLLAEVSRARALMNQSGQSIEEDWISSVNPLSNWLAVYGSGELSLTDDATCPSGSRVLQAGNNSGNDEVWLNSLRSLALDSSKTYRLSAWVKQTAGAGTCYVGLAGRNSLDTEWENATGANTLSSQFYIAASAKAPTSWTKYVGYVRGNTTTDATESPNPNDPGQFYADVRRFRIQLIFNYTAAAGTYLIGRVECCEVAIGSEVAALVPRYLGAKTTDPTSGIVVGDYYLKSNATPKVFRRWSGTAWADVATSDALFSGYVGQAISDLVALDLSASDQSTGGFTFIANLVAKNLFALVITLLSGGEIKSSNYSAGAAGFRIRGDTGWAEFMDVVINGTIKAAVLDASGYIYTNGGKVKIGNDAIYVSSRDQRDSPQNGDHRVELSTNLLRIAKYNSETSAWVVNAYMASHGAVYGIQLIGELEINSYGVITADDEIITDEAYHLAALTDAPTSPSAFYAAFAWRNGSRVGGRMYSPNSGYYGWYGINYSLGW